jgi:hypothetical protein
MHSRQGDLLLLGHLSDSLMAVSDKSTLCTTEVHLLRITNSSHQPTENRMSWLDPPPGTYPLISCQEPSDRQKLPSLMSHSFLDTHLPVTALKPPPASPRTRYRHHNNISSQRGPSPPPSLVAKPTIGSDLRRLLSDEISSSSYHLTKETKTNRRVVSDPAPARDAEEKRRRLGSLRIISQPHSMEPRHLVNALRMTGVHKSSQERREYSKRSPPDLGHQDEPHSALKSPGISLLSPDQTQESIILPIGTTKPSPLTTDHLLSRIHKTPSGYINVLPSHSLLVDFREGLRRSGQRGDEVLVIEPDGLKACIFSVSQLLTKTLFRPKFTTPLI